MTMHPNPALYLSPEMVNELALGNLPPYEIAGRYGLSQGEFDMLQRQDWFGQLVAKRRMEFADEGIGFRAKARMMAEELYQKLFQQATVGTLASNLMLDMTKQLVEIADMKPKQGQSDRPDGPAFQININVNAETAQRPGPRPIEGAARVVAPVTITIPKDDLPARPEGFRVPDFKLTPDLVGTPATVAAVTGIPA